MPENELFVPKNYAKKPNETRFVFWFSENSVFNILDSAKVSGVDWELIFLERRHSIDNSIVNKSKALCLMPIIFVLLELYSNTAEHTLYL